MINNAKCWQEDEEIGTSLCCYQNLKWYSYFGTKFDSFLIKLNISLPHRLTILLLDIYLNETETRVSTNTCTRLFLATLLIIAQN